MYALNIGNDGRILSATYDIYGADGQPRVETLPEGDITDYKYVDGEYVYEPLPKPIEPEPQPSGEEYVTYAEMEKAIKEGVDSYGRK